jgi:hypothetical protein
MPDQGTVAAKLHKLVLMLSSDQPGEVAAAARAIDLTLKQVGADWHTFAGALTQQPPSPQPSQPQASPKMRANSLMAEWILDHHTNRLFDRERNFCYDMLRWRYLSPKQKNWLCKIFVSLEGEVEE